MESTLPIMFDLKVGFSCNNDCIHCVVGDKRPTPDLKTAEIRHILDTKLPLNTDFVVFTGGEPTIRKDFPELLAYVKSKGIKTALQTNGTGFANEDYMRACGPYLDQVLLAIHSSDRDTHNKIVKSNKKDIYGRSMYDLTMQGFLNLLQFPSINIHTQTVVSKWNMATLYDTYSLIQKAIPGKYMHLTYPHPMGMAAKNHDIVCPSYSELKPYLDPVLRDFHSLLAVEAFPLCYLYPYQDSLDYNLDSQILEKTKVRMGIDVSIPFLHTDGTAFFDKDGIAKDYNLNDFSSKRKGPRCAQCVFNSRCVGVWKEYMDYYGKTLDLFPILKDDSTILRSQSTPAIILRSPDDCLNSCLFCFGRRAEDFEEASAYTTFREEADYLIKTRKPTAIEISGEPGQHPFIGKAIQYLKANGVSVITMSTHGRTLKDVAFVKRLKEAGLTNCRIPLYGSTGEIHNKTAQSRKVIGNAFEDTLLGIKNCVSEGVFIIVKIIINKYNSHDLENIIDLYVNLCGNNLKELYIATTGLSQPDVNQCEKWFLPLKDHRAALQRVADNPKYDSLPILFIDIPYCVLERYDDRIRNLSNIPDLGVHQIAGELQSPQNGKIPHYRVKTHFLACEACDLEKQCDGISENEFRIFGTNGLKPVQQGRS